MYTHVPSFLDFLPVQVPAEHGVELCELHRMRGRLHGQDAKTQAAKAKGDKAGLQLMKTFAKEQQTRRHRQ